MRPINYLLFLTSLLTFSLEAQTPIINSVTPVSTYPGDKVLITGSGFSNTPAQLKVTFDHVAGTIISSTSFAIEVTLPAQARYSNVEVLNLVSGLSAKSSMKEIPSFGGGNFDPLKISVPLSNGAADEIFDVCACDLDGDGKPDLMGSKIGFGTDIMILRNTSILGAISFATTTVGVAAPTFNLACGDLNGDGKPDLIASRGGSTRNEIFVLRNTSTVGSITFAPLTTLFMDVGHLAFRLAIRDLNLDGKPEIIVTNAFNSPGNLVYVFVNASTGGTLNISPTPLKFTLSGANTSYGLDVQDLDGDNKPEIIINQFTSNHIFVLRNTSTATISFAASQLINLGATLNNVTTGDFNKDGKLDLAATSSFDNRAIVLLNQSAIGSISFGAAINLSTGDFPWGIDAADADGDGDVDILVGARGAGVVNMTLMRNNGNNTFTPLNLSTGKKSRNVRMGDWNGDGSPDFAYTTDAGNSLDVIQNKNCFVPSIQNASALTICPTQTIRLNSIPGIGVINYDWKESGLSVSSGLSTFYDVTAPGTYTVTATSQAGICISLSNAIVISSGVGTLPADPVISSNSPVCSGPGQNLLLSGPTVAGVNYIWNGPNGFASSLEDPVVPNVTTANAGFYSLQLSNGTCFSNTTTIRVDIADLLNFTVSSSVPSNTICQGSNLTLTVNSQPGYTYQWIKDGVDVVGQTAPTLLVTLEGAYTVRVTDIALSCSVTTSPAVNAIVLTTPLAGFNVNATGCVGSSLTFTDTSTKDPRATAVYVWTFGDAGTSNIPSPTHAYAAASAYSPLLTLSYSGVTGCSNSISKNTVISQTPTITVTSDKTSIVPGESAQLLASGATTYSWTPTIGLSSPDIANPIATPTVATTYAVDGTTSGCIGSASILIDVSFFVPLQPGGVDIPNVFTPNGDSVNDYWVFQAQEAECAISVFDIAGRKIFEQKGPTMTWNGNYNEAPAPVGTYYYIMNCPTGGTTTGHVLLAR